MKRAALMARVSSDEQAKGYSLGVQENDLLKYCERNQIEVVKIYREDHSAKNFERPEFKIFLEFLRKNKGQIDLLLFTSWDRFSRNITESYSMIGKLRKLGVQPQAIEQPIDLSIPENKVMLSFYLAIPEIENDRRSIKITGGIRAARKTGRYTSKAPKGYKNSRDEKNKPLIIPSESAKHILYAFEQVAAGKPLIEVRLNLKKKGVIVSRSLFSTLLRNPVYMGMIWVSASENEPAYLTKAIHQPLVTEKVFNKVQELLTVRKVEKNKPCVTKRREELPLRGVLLCNNCGMNLTGSPSRSRSGKLHFYYHCNHCKKERYAAAIINDSVEKVLSEFRFSADIQSMYKGLAKIVLGSSGKENESRKKILEQQLNLQNERLENLQDMFADKKISFADYSTMKEKYESIKIKSNGELADLAIGNVGTEKLLEQSVKQISNLSKLYATYNLNAKASLLGSIFPEKLKFDGKKCRTTRINELLRLTMTIDKGFRKTKDRTISKNLVLSGLVENIGVEPMTSCMPCKRSSQLS
jgi:site-specific DNA recombinase